MHEELWAGPELKLQYAQFHFVEMGQVLQPPERTAYHVAQMAAGAIIGSVWQNRFYAHFDAFLSTTRSIPEIIQCCFGEDQSRAMASWLKGLAADERRRRADFRRAFTRAYDQFRALPLSNTRHVIEHRTGVAPVEVAVVTFFGVTHVGGPTKRVPDSEIRTALDPELQWMMETRPIEVPTPNWQDFKVDGQPLFATVQAYLNAAGTLVGVARVLATTAHGTSNLTAPPT